MVRQLCKRLYEIRRLRNAEGLHPDLAKRAMSDVGETVTRALEETLMCGKPDKPGAPASEAYLRYMPDPRGGAMEELHWLDVANRDAYCTAVRLALWDRLEGDASELELFKRCLWVQVARGLAFLLDGEEIVEAEGPKIVTRKIGGGPGDYFLESEQAFKVDPGFVRVHWSSGRSQVVWGNVI